MASIENGPNIPLVCKLHVKFPKGVRKDHAQLSPTQIEAQAHSQALAEGNQVLFQLFGILAFPSFGFELLWIRKVRSVLMDKPGAGTDNGLPSVRSRLSSICCLWYNLPLPGRGFHQWWHRLEAQSGVTRKECPVQSGEIL
jgi:hypothetical protein